MLIAHLPAGYLLGRFAQCQLSSKSFTLMGASILGNMAPDFDMLYFHFIDARTTPHHDYFTHWPLFWLAVGASLVATTCLSRRASVVLAMLFFIGTMMHMIMDSVAAPIHWLAPFSNMTVELVTVPATSSNWIISFVYHWTFLIEIAIWVLALTVFLSGKKTSLEKSNGM
jgi:inner membrane protein